MVRSSTGIPSPAGLRVLVIVAGPSTDRPSSGKLMRRHHLIRAASRVASVEIFVTENVGDQVLDEMSSIYGARVGCVRSRGEPRRVARFVQRFRHIGAPTRVARKDWQALRQELQSWMSSYQATVVELIDDFLILAPILPAPVVLDHDDRESESVRQTRALFRMTDEARLPYSSLAERFLSVGKAAGRDLYLSIEHYRWLRAQRFAMRRADSVLVASHEDVLRSEKPRKAVVVPNGFDLRGSPAGSGDVHTPPTVAFWGQMSYRPNRDGAQWFLSEVLPILVSRLPDVRVLLVGAGSERLTLPTHHVLATGFVHDLSALLSETDVAVVPLRAGGGTRIKIIEAWANKIPVVSTSVGAYGLGAIDGESVLLADDPEAFASAIVSVLEDPALRRRLIVDGTARARALEWPNIEKELSRHLVQLSSRVLSQRRLAKGPVRDSARRAK